MSVLGITQRCSCLFLGFRGKMCFNSVSRVTLCFSIGLGERIFLACTHTSILNAAYKR